MPGEGIGARAPEGDEMAPAQTYKRLLLKLSGEALMGEQGYGIDTSVLQTIADELVQVHEMGVLVAIVIGGRHIMRRKRTPTGRLMNYDTRHRTLIALLHTT